MPPEIMTQLRQFKEELDLTMDQVGQLACIALLSIDREDRITLLRYRGKDFPRLPEYRLVEKAHYESMLAEIDHCRAALAELEASADTPHRGKKGA